MVRDLNNTEEWLQHSGTLSRTSLLLNMGLFSKFVLKWSRECLRVGPTVCIHIYSVVQFLDQSFPLLPTQLI